MAILRCYQWDGDKSVVHGYTYEGILFGDPLEIDGDPATAEYDHVAFPQGIVKLVDGEIVVIPDADPEAL
jgi:hypothetical protein